MVSYVLQWAIPWNFFIKYYLINHVFFKHSNGLYTQLHYALLLSINRFFNNCGVLIQDQDFVKNKGLGQGQVLGQSQGQKI